MHKNIIIVSTGKIEDEQFVKNELIKKNIAADRINFIPESEYTEQPDNAIVVSLDMLKEGLGGYQKYEFIRSNNKTVSVTKWKTERRKDKLANGFNEKLSSLLEDFFNYEEQGHSQEDVNRKLEGSQMAWKNWLGIFRDIYYCNKAEKVFMSRVNFLLFLRLAIIE